MANQSGDANRNSLPHWWNLDLYRYLDDLPLEGWAWEFIRRWRLLSKLKGKRPVDAMNPSPDIQDGDGEDFIYYDNWTANLQTVGPPYVTPLAAYCPKYRADFPLGHTIALEEAEINKDYVIFRIDLKRRNESIIRDLRTQLKVARSQAGVSPIRISARIDDWRTNRILAVWDLRQYNLSWNTISELAGHSNIAPYREKRIEYMRRYFKSAEHYIGRVKESEGRAKFLPGRWVDLIRFIEKGLSRPMVHIPDEK